MKIIGVYKIVNTVTNDFYIGSSKDVKKRWANHKCPSTWENYPNSQLYKDMQKYGVDKFDFQVLLTTESENLKKAEQQFIEKLKPTYNNIRAKDYDIKKAQEKYHNQLCSYNSETLTLSALSQRFKKAGIEHYVSEAKKYLLI